jgi:hypothetical protein
MENKQTAVDWIRKELEGHGSPSALNIDWETFDELIAQAKAMEKQQMFEFWNGGIDCTEEKGKSFEQYYNETYGGSK